MESGADGARYRPIRTPVTNVVATSNALSYPFARMASRKVCQYPKYPKFTGSNPDDADSYTCVDSK